MRRVPPPNELPRQDLKLICEDGRAAALQESIANGVESIRGNPDLCKLLLSAKLLR